MSGHPVWAHDNVVSLALIGSQNGQAIVNVMHFHQAAGVQDPAGAADFCGALATDFDTNARVAWLGAHTADYTLDVIRTTPAAVSGVAHPSFASHELVPTTTNGTFVANGGPLEDCALIKLRTALGGKSHRGRIYVGPVPSGAGNNGILGLAGYLTALTTLRTALARYLPGGAFVATGALAIFSRPLHAGEQQWTVRVGGTLELRANLVERPGDYTPVTTLVQDLVVRTQRRREVGVGA